MVDAPETGEKMTEQLLDGQQRLTALWRSLNGFYRDRTYLVGFEDDPAADSEPLRWTFSGPSKDLGKGSSASVRRQDSGIKRAVL